MFGICGSSCNVRLLVVALVCLSITLPVSSHHLPFPLSPGQAFFPPPSSAISSAPQLWADKVPIDLATQIASQANKHARQNVIIQFSSAFGVRHHALITKLGGIVRHQFGNRDSVLAEISLGKIEELARDERVRQITPDRNVSANLDAAKIVTGADVARKKAQSVYGTTYSALDGSGIGVAVIDSGVGMNAANKEFVATSGNSRLVHFKDFSDDLGATRAYDDYGHGTGVAGVIAGNGWASKQTGADRLEWYPGNYGDFDGLAPNASIVALRVIRKDGSGTISSVIKAIDYAIALQAKYNIRIINISLGAPVVQSYRTDPLCLAAARAVSSCCTRGQSWNCGGMFRRELWAQ